MPINNQRKKFSALGALVAACVAFGCTKEKLGLTKSESPSEGTIDITAVYPTPDGVTWTAVKDGDSRYYIRGLQVSVAGSCSESVKKVRVKAGAILLPEISECVSGTYTWSKTFAATEQGNMSLKIVAFGENALQMSAEKKFLLRIDTVGPNAPLLSFPTANPYEHLGASGNVTVTGSVSPDTVKLVGPGGTEIVLNGTLWTYDIDLAGGATMNFDFTAHDFAGNTSTATALVASWNAAATLKVASTSPGGGVSDGTTGFSVEVSTGPVVSHAMDVSTSFRLETGFNNLTNQLRAE